MKADPDTYPRRASRPSPTSLAGLRGVIGRARHRRRARLATQLTAAMAIITFLSVVVMLGGMIAFYVWSYNLFRGTLSPSAQRAYDLVELNQLPSQTELEALLNAYQAWESGFEFRELIALIGLGIVALLVGIIAGRWLAARISDPVHRVAAAARRVAAGDRTVRVAVPGHGVGEIHQLIADFNMMAREMERSEREMRESIAAIAHELRTPLTVLRGRLQGMADGVFPPDRNGLDGLILQTDALSQIIEDLRILSLAMSGRLVMRPTMIDLATEAGQTIDAFSAELARAGMTAERDLGPVRLAADGARLRQILLALLDNARRYAASGGTVRIETGSDARGAFLRVLDRGPGISAEDAERLFQRFWRADDSRSRDSGGTGLGLAVVKAIAEAHGGSACAARRDGGGARFEVRLPC
ncbi:HAMP domain-containing protein [Sphingomonas koreensis]|jgi:two-component system sensor histidine kinase AdeS|uniref:histidine kinase n=2 Tax=Sphingomonas koreensis TaxID=93064 RepID=A0A430G4J6_9SPHN|nr:ATP-binding protein [Sphingomonas koreensis]RSU18980.1 HAMP domain-containing protein [Sphingomonas koreensis]RSU24055.1 HAMP domain-containing protein [Sphingomonas koreensis]RSU26306.1 HAMP domain-containing protein [Sphingomonas koreensis]RSU33895.1 HAMP domain-containing protein [Sphingomonas koreensis]RSU36607.1 HAMP domain-containing protein [Sphingomonas koreensis]